MPRLIPFRLAAACVAAALLSLSLAATALAKGVPVDVRVVGSGGKLLTEQKVQAKTTAVPTSSKATCFGPDSGGSGKPVTLKGPTALGALAQAAESSAKLRPLLITDSFDFGLGICGVGGEQVRSKNSTSWYFKVNHRSQPVGGDQVKLKAGDEVLWALVATEAPDYSYPDELALTAPGKATAGQPFTVRVFSYDEKGRRTPAAGVKVTGAAEPTGSDGRATVVLAKPARLIARGEGEIPSNRVAVCLGRKCPK